MMKGTESFNGSYKRFGDVMYVDHWFGKMAEPYSELYGDDTLINADKKRKVINISRQPLFFKRVIQLENKKYERLLMNENTKSALVTRNGKYIHKDFSTAQQIELFARKKKQHDWQIEIIEAFESLIFQRQGRKKWVLIEIGKGFA